MSKVLFATTTSPTGDSDRAIQTLNVDGTGLTTLFDVVGSFDSAPAWSPDGSRSPSRAPPTSTVATRKATGRSGS